MANFDTIKTAIDANIKTNGTQDITGGKMNSILKQMVDATGEQLTGLESDVNPILDALSFIPQYEENEGKYITREGSLGSSAGFACTTPFDLQPNQTISVYARGYLYNVVIIAIAEQDGRYTPLKWSYDNNPHVFQYTNDTGNTLQIACSFSTGYSRTIRILENKSYILAESVKNDTKQLSYPYGVGESNLITGAEIVGLAQGVKKSVLKNTDGAEPNFLRLEITRTSSYDWSYYWTKDLGYKAAGEYCAFIKVKRNGTSPVNFQVFSEGGVTLAQKNISNLISDKYEVFSAKVVLDATKKVMIGISYMAAGDNAVIGDSFDICLMGFAKDRTDFSIGSDIYTTEDKNLISGVAVKPMSYPYSIGENNTIKTGISTGLVSSGAISWKVANNNGNIEKKCVEITITNPTPNDWGYYWTKDLGNKPVGKYCAFINVKQKSTSPIWLIVFSTGGSILAQREITNEISSEYQLFAIDFEITSERRVMVGVTSGQRVSDKIQIGDIVNISLIGLAKDRTNTTLLSDLYTLEDYKDAIGGGQVGNVEEIATMAIFEGIPVMGIIGDSLSSGVTHNGTTLITDYNYAWWRVLERDSGQKYIPFAQGGLTTRSWLSNYLANALKPENKCCAYTIGLQVNDAYSLGDSYLGTPDDIDLADYNNNNDTYYGNYAKIIQALTANNPKCKFFLFTEPRKTGEADSKWNGAVRYIAELFDNCYIVDLQDMYNSLYLGGFIKDTIGPQAHYPSIAYSYMGKLIEKAIGETIKENAGDFKYIQFAIE